MRALALVVLVALLAGCASPDADPSPTPSPSRASAPTTPPASPPLSPSPSPSSPSLPPPVPHDLGDVGVPAQKRPLAWPDWLPADYLAYDANASRVFERTIHGTRVVVAIHEGLLAMPEIGGHAVRPGDELATFFFEAFDAAWHVFGGFAYEEARIVVRGPNEACAFQSATAVGFPICYQDHAHVPGDASRPPHPLTEARIPELFTHELFHLWNGGIIQATPRETEGFLPEAWWTEGATTYYAALLARDGYERAMASEEAKVKRLLPEAGGLSFEELAARTPPPRSGPSPYTDMLYARGALVSRALDAELAKHDRDLDEIMRALYLEALEGATFTTADIERLAGPELAPFFESFVRGHESITP